MNIKIKRMAQQSDPAIQDGLFTERADMGMEILERPLQPVLRVSGNTDYESLSFVGYHPQQARLEAVVDLHHPSGYGTDICGPGSPEYVRFYLSFNNGATWHDQGSATFQAHNIPKGVEGRKRLGYAVSLTVDPKKKICFLNSSIRVRAILSWNDPPPADQPHWAPVWGNRCEADIQVVSRRIVSSPPNRLETPKIKTPPDFHEICHIKEEFFGILEHAIHLRNG